MGLGRAVRGLVKDVAPLNNLVTRMGEVRGAARRAVTGKGAHNNNTTHITPLTSRPPSFTFFFISCFVRGGNIVSVLVFNPSLYSRMVFSSWFVCVWVGW